MDYCKGSPAGNSGRSRQALKIEMVSSEHGVHELFRRTIASPARDIARLYRKSIGRVSGLRHPILARSLRATLVSLGTPPRIVFFHSSLSACGYVRGGAEAVISALRAWCAGSTLAMPTHSYCYPDSRGEVPVFDPRSTPSVVGSITNAFARQPGVSRSLHPTHSLAAEGPLAQTLIAGHENCETPCGPGTPYERLVNWDAGILMFGVTLDCYTLFHTAEDAAKVPYLYEAEPYDLKMNNPAGGVRTIRMKRQDMQVQRRFAEMDNWFEEQGFLERRRLGCGELLWIAHSRAAHSALVAQLGANPFLLVSKQARENLSSAARPS
jgi:aminoglycoside 3-N-acetyltransferase